MNCFFCCCFFFSATLFVSASQPESLCKQQKTWWYGRHQQLLPLNTNRHRVLPPHSTFCFRESMENLLSNGSLQHHQFFFVSEPHDSTKHSLLYSKNNSFCTYSYMFFEWGGASWFKKKKNSFIRQNDLYWYCTYIPVYTVHLEKSIYYTKHKVFYVAKVIYTGTGTCTVIQTYSKHAYIELML